MKPNPRKCYQKEENRVKKKEGICISEQLVGNSSQRQSSVTRQAAGHYDGFCHQVISN